MTNIAKRLLHDDYSMGAISDYLDGLDGFPVSPVYHSLMPAELSEIVAIAIQLARQADWALDEFWLGFSYAGRQFAFCVYGMDNDVTVLMDLYHANFGVAQADRPILTGMHLPWVCVD